MLYSSERRFQVWRWTVSHSELLLRSNPTAAHERRIEVMFKPVSAACLPSAMQGLQIVVADAAAQHAWRALGHGGRLEKDEALFLVGSASFAGWVVSLGASGREDDGDYKTPSSFDGFEPVPEVTELFSSRRT